MGLPARRLESGSYWVVGMEVAGGKVDGLVPTGSVAFLGLTLAMLQVADGFLTSLGVSRFGTSSEGNPILRTLMEEFGHIPTIATLKFIAVAIILGLVLSARSIPWIKGALGAITFIYLFAAILPWTYLLFLRPLIIG